MGGEPVVSTARATTAGVTLEWSAMTDVGNERAVNEDSLLARSPVFVVADGMGGHRAGDVASALVVDRFAGVADGELRSVEEIVGLLEDANSSIIAEGSSSLAREGMGTTAVGLLLVDSGDRPSWLILNVGDSRAYRFADGTLEQLSTDHSYVQELVDAGQISVGSARTHPHRNVVTRALGAEEGLRPDLWIRPPRAGERFLLCTDGLSTEVDDEGIRRLLSSGSPEQAAGALVRGALDAGGHDNVTVLVVDVLRVDDGVPPEITEPRDLVEDEATAEHSVLLPGRSAGERMGSLGRPVAPSEPDPVGLIDRVPGLDELVGLTAGEGTPESTPEEEPLDDDESAGDDPAGDDAAGDDAAGDDAAGDDAAGDDAADDDAAVDDPVVDEVVAADPPAGDDGPVEEVPGQVRRSGPAGAVKGTGPKSRTNRRRSAGRGE